MQNMRQMPMLSTRINFKALVIASEEQILCRYCTFFIVDHFIADRTTLNIFDCSKLRARIFIHGIQAVAELR